MSEPEKKIDFKDIVIGQWADYLDTGIWSMKDGQIVAPPDLTLEQVERLPAPKRRRRLRGEGWVVQVGAVR
jgi:hypothetical protein